LLALPPGSVAEALLRALTCVVLPAALLFRSHYRAYPRGRLMLGIAYALAFPFLVKEAFLIGQSPVMARIGAALVVSGALSGLFPSMAAPPTGMTALCAQSLTALAALDIGLRQLYRPAAHLGGPLAYPLTAVTFFASVVPIALGLFQTLSAIYAPDARRVDV